MPPARLRLVFAGTPAFAVPCLQVCIDAASVGAVYTQPDRPAGRGRRLAPGAVKQAAIEAGLQVEQPVSLKASEAQRRLAAHAPDLVVVVAYGSILPRAVLSIPRLGCWNLHASLLPRWRGAAPIQRALLAGDAETGVCLMRMEAGLDTGPVLLRRATPIRADDTGGSLHDRLAGIAADLLRAALTRIQAGETLAETPQAALGVTHAHKIEKAEAALDFARPATELERKVRAFDPWPVAEMELVGDRVRVWRAEAGDRGPWTRQQPGEVVAASRHGIYIACAEGVLRIVQLQRPGGRVVGAADYLNARPELRR